MGNPNGIRTVLLLVPPMFLLLPISVLTFVFERISRALLIAQTMRDWRSGGETIALYGPTTTGSTDNTYSEIELKINKAPTRAVIAICVVAYIVSVLGTCGVWELRRIEGTMSHQRIWSWTLLVSHAAMAAGSIAVLAFASSVQGSENKWESYEDVTRGKRFTRETWSCQIDEFYPQQDWAAATCGLSKATRFMLIPMALSSILVMVSTWILVRDRGGVKWLVGGKGRYGAFDNLYEMKPQAPMAAPAPFVPVRNQGQVPPQLPAFR